MKIALGADHAGVDLKKIIVEALEESGVSIKDFGTMDGKSADFPDFAEKVGENVANGNFEFGILICGTGLGMSYTANKINGIRAALCFNEYMAEMARSHNDANILVLGARVLNAEDAKLIMEKFFDTPFSQAERHIKRIQKITELETRINKK